MSIKSLKAINKTHFLEENPLYWVHSDMCIQFLEFLECLHIAICKALRSLATPKYGQNHKIQLVNSYETFAYFFSVFCGY